jgi:tRNA(Ser,Leu) C12 N-acetylase TAN1
MRDWNVVVSVRGRELAHAMRLLRPFGRVDRSGFFNVLVMHVEDWRAMLDALQRLPEVETHVLSRVVPATHAFAFQSPCEFEEKARRAVETFVPTLGGKSFHVRVHRRGSKGRLASQHEEQQLDTFLLDALGRAGAQGRMTFDDPDAIVCIEIVGTRAGVSLWTRDELRLYPLVRLD